jgi:hypothetical protein
MFLPLQSTKHHLMANDTGTAEADFVVLITFSLSVF